MRLLHPVELISTMISRTRTHCAIIVSSLSRQAITLSRLSPLFFLFFFDTCSSAIDGQRDEDSFSRFFSGIRRHQALKDARLPCPYLSIGLFISPSDRTLNASAFDREKVPNGMPLEMLHHREVPA
jgi:hypothetical protein